MISPRSCLLFAAMCLRNALCAFAICVPLVSDAAVLTWSGSGEDHFWGTADNWGGAAPSDGDSLEFSGLLRLGPVNNLTADTAISGIRFVEGAGGFDISGARILLQGNVTNLSASAQTLRLAMILSGARSFDTGAADMTLAGALSGDGGLVKTGSGQLLLSGSEANTYTGLTVVNGGTLRLDKTVGINAISGDLTINSGGLVTFGNSHQIGDATHVSISGSGSVFNGTAPNMGIRSMTETIGSLTVTGGTFNAGNSIWTIQGGVSFTGGADNTLFVGNSGARLTMDRLTISGMSATAGGTVSRANSFTLYGNSAILSTITVGSGGLFLEGSRLNLRRGAQDMAGSRVVLNGNVTATGTVASFITEDTNGGVHGMVRVELSGEVAAVERTFHVADAAGNLTLNVEIANGASTSAGLVKTGPGTLTFSGEHANTYTGDTRITGGTLVLNQTSGVTAVAGNILVENGGRLTLSTDEQIHNGAGITVESGGLINAWTRIETLAYYTQNGGGLPTSGNTGQMIVLGTMTLNGGTTLTLNSRTAPTPAHFQAWRLVMTGADLLLGGNNGSTNPRTAFTVGAGGLVMDGRTITLYRGTAGTVLNLNGNFTGNGSSFIIVENSGAVEPLINLGNATRTFNIESGTTTISVAIAGEAGLTKTGDGTLALTGSLGNSISGTVMVSGGVLNLNRTSGTDVITGPLVVTSGGTLTLTTNEQIKNTTGITMEGGTISAFRTTETLAFYTQNSGGFTNSGNTGNLTVEGLVTLNGGTTLTINSRVSATAPQWSFGGAVLTGANMLVGGTNGEGNPKTRLTLGELGLTLAGRSLTLNRAPTGGTELFLNGKVTATGTSAITAGGSGAIEPELHLGSGTRTFQITSGVTTVGMTMLGAAGVEKTGGGVLVLTEANSYTGGTTIRAGALRITNSSGSATGSGTFLVENGAILSGNGRIAPASGQDIRVLGTLLVGTPSPTTGETLTLQAAGLGVIEINGQVQIQLFSGQDQGGGNGTPAADRLVLGGSNGLTLGTEAILSVSTDIVIDATNSAGWVPGTAWQVIDWSGLTGPVNGGFANLNGGQVANFANLPDLSPLGYFWDVSDLYTQGIIVVAVPEPSRGVFLVMATAAFSLRRRRKPGVCSRSN